MKHNFFVLFAACGALAAVGFAGSHTQTARAAVQVMPVRAQAPVAVVIALDGSRSVATCIATTCVVSPCVVSPCVVSPCVVSPCVTTTCVATPSLAVACCDPSCDPKKVRAAPSFVRVSTGGNGQVLVCGNGNGSLCVGTASAQGTCASPAVVSGSGLVSVGYASGNGTCTSAAVGSGSNVLCTAGPSACSAGPGSCSAGQSSCSAGQGSCSAGQGSCSAGEGAGSCTSTSVLGRGGPSGTNVLSFTGQTLGGTLTLAQAPSLLTQSDAAGQTVDLGELVQGLRGSVGTLVMQDPKAADSDEAPSAFGTEDGSTFKVFEMPDSPKVADAQDMDVPDMNDDSDDESGPDVTWTSKNWKEQVEEALTQARAQVDGSDEDTREAIERAQEEIARAQSGWASGDAQRAYKEAMEKAQVDWHAAMADSARAQAEEGARQHAGLLASTQAQAGLSKEQQERVKSELRLMQAGQQKRAHAEGEARSSNRKRSAEDTGLEARIEALEKIAKARGREVSGDGSLESRVAELERAMRGQGADEARAPRAARVIEVPRGGVFKVQEKAPRFEVARPATPRTAPRVATPRTPPTPPTPPTPATPRTSKMRAGTLSKMPGMDADARRDLEQAMSDLRKEAGRLREEMSKLRNEIDRLPHDSSR